LAVNAISGGGSAGECGSPAGFLAYLYVGLLIYLLFIDHKKRSFL